MEKRREGRREEAAVRLFVAGALPSPASMRKKLQTDMRISLSLKVSHLQWLRMMKEKK